MKLLSEVVWISVGAVVFALAALGSGIAGYDNLQVGFGTLAIVTAILALRRDS